MNRDNTPWQPATHAELDWVDEHLPRANNFDDVYYSAEDGLSESYHVFIEGNAVVNRLASHPHSEFRIGESGFGTGLNFLLAWRTWRQSSAPRPRLHYIATERYPMRTDDLKRALSRWPELSELGERLVDAYPLPVKGIHRLALDDGMVVLDLHFEDSTEALTDLATRGQTYFDAWFLDGFAPARNAAMWQSQMFQAISGLSRAGCTLATFTAAGQVRRDLESAGFEVEKVPGFGRKRECVRGRLRVNAAAAKPRITPWDLRNSTFTRPTTAIVLGAGLAGCTTAAALARRGITVTVVDQGAVADGASANDQGVLYTRLSHKHSYLADFALQSFLYATGLYRTLLESGTLESRIGGDLCGCFQRVPDPGVRDRLRQTFAALPELAQIIDAADATAFTGVRQTEGGYWLPQSGWLHPGAVCRALLQLAQVQVNDHFGQATIDRKKQHWEVHNDRGQSIEADCLIIATGTEAASLAGLDWLPTRAIRGQTTHLPSRPPLCELRSVLCHQGHIAPAREGEHCIGASFNLDDNNTAICEQDHADNLEKLAAVAPDWATALQQLTPGELDGKVRFRCASPDYLPLVGPLPDRDSFLQTFAALRNNGRDVINSQGSYVPDLFLNIAHGSRGLTSTPLSAELLASQVCNEPSPLHREAERALAPARFLIRDLVRNRH